MEQNFQTSFIPKKPIIEGRNTPKKVNPSVGIFTMIALFAFFAVVIGSGFAFFYKKSLANNLEQMKKDLEIAKGRFEPAVITKLQTLDKRLMASQELLNKHIAVSPIFEMLQISTIKTIRFTKFTYEIDDKGQVKVKMSGQSVGYGPNSGYMGIALQNEILSKNKNIIDPVFYNLSLNDKGSVLFDLDFIIDPSFVDYKQMLKGEDPTNPEGSQDATN